MESHQKTKKRFSLYDLCEGKPGEAITAKNFLKLTDTGKQTPGGFRYKIKLPDGYEYKGQSAQEIKVIKKLLSHKAFRHLRGQCISIPDRYNAKNHCYYPDLILLTNSKKVVILEVKAGGKVDLNNRYVWFKNNCPLNGPCTTTLDLSTSLLAMSCSRFK